MNRSNGHGATPVAELEAQLADVRDRNSEYALALLVACDDDTERVMHCLETARERLKVAR